MPAQSRLMIRLSLVYLMVGITLGAVMLFHKAFPIHPAIWVLLPAHIQILIWGWIIQFTLGMAYWILPRFLTGESRGSSSLSWMMIITLNAGICLNLTAIALDQRVFDIIGLLLQVTAVGLFVLLHWERATSYNK